MRHQQHLWAGPTVFPDKPRKHHPRQMQLEPALCIRKTRRWVEQDKLTWGGVGVNLEESQANHQRGGGGGTECQSQNSCGQASLF